MIKVLIAEDSVVFQKVLLSFLSKDDNIKVVGVVDNGMDAIEQCKQLKPDLITMDIFMPTLNGLEATRRIMAECPTRIVIISSMIDAKNLQYSLEAIQAGAVEVIAKPQDMISGNYDLVREKLIRVLRQTMNAQPLKRFSWLVSHPWDSPKPMMVPSVPEPVVQWPTKKPLESSNLSSSFSRNVKSADGTTSRNKIFETSTGKASEKDDNEPIVVKWRPQPIPHGFVPHVICIGGSTGAPAVISDVLRCLPADFKLPILIAQHIVKGFVQGMADWLNSIVSLNVGIAKDGQRPGRGQVLFAPDDAHLSVNNGHIKLQPRSPNDLYVPSVDRLFKSVAKDYGPFSLGIVLSGMGRDGAEGLLEMRRTGAVTLGQNSETSVVYGMPKVALSRGAVMDVMGPEGMVRALLEMNDRLKKKNLSS